MRMGHSMDIAGLKRRLRELKRIEQKIRSGSGRGKTPLLIWEAFFDMRDTGAGKAKYPLKILAAMDHETLKRVIGEYWSFVYSELFCENDIPCITKFDTDVLLKWGLPPDADADTIKKKFRELAKLYHPDTGGDEHAFIALMESYKKLTGK